MDIIRQGFFFILRLLAALFIVGGFASGLLALSHPVRAEARLSLWQVVASAATASVIPSTTVAGALPPASTERVTMLVMGVDRRDDADEWDVRADSLIVLSLDPQTKTASVLSIPRDLWVPIPLPGGRIAQDRINSAMVYAYLSNYPGGGPALVRDTVQYNFGIPINHYAVIDFRAFRRVIDAIGGITVDVPSAIVDYQYPTDDYGIMRISIPAGEQHFDGEQALWYARSRHQDSDFGRMQRQQLVMLAVREKLLRLEMLPRAPALWADLSGMIETDLSLPEIIQLGTLARDVSPGAITSRVLDGQYVASYTTRDGASVLLPQRSRIRPLVQELFSDAPTAPRAAALLPPSEDGVVE